MCASLFGEMISHTVAEYRLYIWKEMCWKQSLMANFKIINNSLAKRKISTHLEIEIMLGLIYCLAASAQKVPPWFYTLWLSSCSEIGHFVHILTQKYRETLAQISQKWLSVYTFHLRSIQILDMLCALTAELILFDNWRTLQHWLSYWTGLNQHFTDLSGIMTLLSSVGLL